MSTSERQQTIKQMPKSDRPREKLIAKGPSNLKDVELLAVLLGTGYEGASALEVAEKILQKYSKNRVLRLTHQELSRIKGVGLVKACVILAAQEFIKRALGQGEVTLPVIRTAKDIIAQAVYLREKTREHFMVLYLNGRNEMIYKKPMFVGTLNANLVHPREIFAEALKQNAASVVFAHNHPSGNPEPSSDDLCLTKKLVEAGKIMGIEVLDHIIIAQNKVFSFKDQRLL